MKIGFLINPIAGMGGRVGLKGTDDLAEEAARRGARPVAPGRAQRTLRLLRRTLAAEAAPEWITCAGAMGEDALREAGFDAVTVAHRPGPRTSRADTAEAARRFLEAGVGLILFCGGDGTARDVAAVAGRTVPILGIPSGVKMYSGVFGVTPERTAEIVAGFLSGALQPAEVDVLDLDEERFRAGEWVVRLVSAALTPYEPTLTQAAKAIVLATGDAEDKADIAEDLRERMAGEPDTLFLLGPGSTVAEVAARLGVEKTLLGVDAVRDGELIGRDLDERGLLALLDRHQEAQLILSPIGAQGFVLGRGNLQLSPAVVRRIGPENVTVVATQAKLRRTPALRFDTGDAALDREFGAQTYISVIVGYHRRRLTPVRR